MPRKGQNEKRKREHDNGFEEWGGYMNAKISKLEAQFNEDQKSLFDKNGRTSNIFEGISIFVNGYTVPSADELRCLMLQHGGVYHHYYRSGKTTHIIASSLPNAKFNQMNTLKVVKCEWITDSIQAKRLLDYKNYLLFNNFPLNVKSKKENILMKLVNIAGSSANPKESEIPKTAADDGYLTDFYKNSRLHYISTLGAALKQHVQEMRDSHNGFFPGRTRLQQLNLETTTTAVAEDFGESFIMHIDMDCFFVAVALRNHPHLKGQPVAVTHSKGKGPVQDRNFDRKFERKFYKEKMKAKLKPKAESSSESDDNDDDEEWDRDKSSMSEIASCSYEARKAGVRKGMYLGVALKLCPNLKTVTYDFDGYREVSMTLYNTVAEYTLDIEAISCDELFIDCTNLLGELKIDPIKFAEVLRKEIQDKTSCTASAGIGRNKLQARLATKHAKPNGQFYLTPDAAENFMKSLDVCELPGVGRTINAKLRDLSVKTCGDLQKLPLVTLKREFGERTGEALYKHSRGQDDRKVNYSHERKSVSAEVNYGIRFNDDEETEIFLKQLSEEVCKRLRDIKMTGKNITFKVMYRAKNAPVETAKFLGHGVCDQINRSVALPVASDNPEVISKHVIGLYHQLGIPPNDLRGIGIQITKLEGVKKNKKTLQDFLSDQKKKPPTSAPLQNKTKTVLSTAISTRLPTASQIDPEVLASLPKDIQEEVLNEYGLVDLLPEKKEETGTVFEPTLDDNSVKKLFSLNLNDMRTMMKEWVAAETRPRSYDINMLKSYLNRLVEEKNLETVSIIVRCLNRHVKSKREGDEVWKETYDEVVDAVQNWRIENLVETRWGECCGQKVKEKRLFETSGGIEKRENNQRKILMQFQYTEFNVAEARENSERSSFFRSPIQRRHLKYRTCAYKIDKNFETGRKSHRRESTKKKPRDQARHKNNNQDSLMRTSD